MLGIMAIAIQQEWKINKIVPHNHCCEYNKYNTELSQVNNNNNFETTIKLI